MGARVLITNIRCINISVAVGVSSMSSPTVANSIYFGGRGTSVTLEDAFWQGLKEIARRRRMKLPDLIRAIERQDSNLSSAIRLYVDRHSRMVPFAPLFRLQSRFEFHRREIRPCNDNVVIEEAHGEGGHRPQSSSASRFTAGASRFLNFSQSGERPER